MLSVLLSQELRDRHSRRRFADTALQVNEADDMSLLALEGRNPSLNLFSLPYGSALKDLVWAREVVVSQAPVADCLLRYSC